MSMQYPATELVLNKYGQVYHLGLSPDQISDKIILVGDQDRVDIVAAFFDVVEVACQHREFVTKTGMYQGKRITVLSTGIGTDNIDIVMNELDALANIQLDKRIDADGFKSLKLVRIGTCGILQPAIPLHSFILSSHACGLDNVAHFYDIEFSKEEMELNTAIQQQVQFPAKIKTYVSKVSNQLFDQLASDKTVTGITITSSGFYGPQGRQLRLKTKTEKLNEQITAFNFENHRIVNFEMESSALFALGKAMGHKCATICLGIANRPNKDFSKDYSEDMENLIQYVLDRI